MEPYKIPTKEERLLEFLKVQLDSNMLQSISKVAAQAEAFGLTYGQYVALAREPKAFREHLQRNGLDFNICMAYAAQIPRNRTTRIGGLQ